MWHWLAVGLGGALGAISRYALSSWVVRRFPVGTLAANLIGCFLIGLLMAFAVKAKVPNPIWRTFLVGGFLGALTTFSTFGYQTVELAREHNLSLSAINLFSNVGLGILAVCVGIWLGEILVDSWKLAHA